MPVAALADIDPAYSSHLPALRYSLARPQLHERMLGIVQHLEWGARISFVFGFVLGAFLDRPRRGSGLYGKSHLAAVRVIARST